MSIESEIKMSANDTVSVNDTLTVLKYRPGSAYKYDNYDKLYAMEMKRHFSKLSENAQNEFNLFTDNLMIETFINRNKLLDAISDFKKTDYFKKTSKEQYELPNYAWIIFDDNSYNCRPYQPCIIS